MSKPTSPILPPKENKVKDITIQIEDVKNIMNDNIVALNKNMDSADHLRDKSEDLKVYSTDFKKNATSIKRQMCMKNLKLKIITGSVILFVLAVFIIIIVMSFKK